MRLVRTPSPTVPPLPTLREVAPDRPATLAPAAHVARQTWRLFAAALAIRLAYCLATVPLTPADEGAFDYFYSSDGYCILARTWYHAGKFAFHPDADPTLFRTPGYVIALVGAYALLGNLGLAAIAVNCTASAATCVLIWRTLRELAPSAAHGAAWALAFFPLSIHYCARSFDNTFITLTTTLVLIAGLRLWQSPSWRRGALAGLALGFAILTKPVVLPLVAVIPLFSALAHRRALAAATISGLVACLTIAPWTFRNYLVSGKFVPIGTGTAYNLLAGTYLADSPGDSRAGWASAVARTAATYERYTGKPLDVKKTRHAYFYEFTPAAEREFASVVRRSMVDEPWLWAKKIVVNLARFWYYSSGADKAVASLAFNLPILSLGLIALWRLCVMGGDARLLATWLATSGSIYILTYAAINVHSTRYALPVLVWLVGLAPLGAMVVWRALRGVSADRSKA